MFKVYSQFMSSKFESIAMKVAFIQVLLCFALCASATGQEGDVIMIDGERWNLLGKPIDYDSVLYHRLLEVLPKDRSISTANWDGYRGYWSIKNNRLCLDHIEIELYDKETKHSHVENIPEADMRKVFGKYYQQKEIVASSIGVLYAGDDEIDDDDDDDDDFSDATEFSDDSEKYTRLRQQMLRDGITPLSAYAYLIFILLYFPCIATIAAIKNETGSWHWALFAAGYTTVVAWIVSALVYQIGPGTNLMGYGLLKVVDGKAQMMTMGVIDLRKFPDAYLKLGHIFERVTTIIDGFLPDEMAIEAPFFGKNVQSMLKLGRAQGTAIAAAIHHGVPIHEYAPMKIKMAITGNGNAAKEQVAGMLQRLLKIPNEEMSKFMDATDALAAAYCHYMQMGKPESDVKYRGWKDFVNKNKEKVSKRKTKNEDD